MARILVKANLMVTMDEELGVLSEGAVVIEGDRIADVGPHERLKREGPFDEELGSLRSSILLPGLIDAHHHGRGTFRDGIADIPLELWLPYLTAGAEGGFSFEEIYLQTQWAAMELIRAGVTSVVNLMPTLSLPDFGAGTALQAYWDLGMRACLGPLFWERYHFAYEEDESFLRRLSPDLAAQLAGKVQGFDIDEYLKRWRGVFDTWHGRGGRLKVYLAPTGVTRTSEASLRRMKAEAEDRSTGLQTHALETRYQALFAERVWRKSAVRHLLELGVLGPQFSLAHMVWTHGEDMTILADTGTVCVHNPSVNLRLFSGVAPVSEMFRRGVQIALGTDGTGVNDDNDLFSDLRLACFLQRAPGIESKALSGADWLGLLYRGGSRVMGEADNLGSLSPGKKADLVLLRKDRIFDSPAVNPWIDPVEGLVHRACCRDVQTVLVDGRPVLKDGKFQTVDEEGVRARLSELKHQKFERMNPERRFFEELDREIKRFYRQWEDPPLLSQPTAYRYNQV
ncbi:MAG: amidohydrolase family protein [Nitrospinota bacterium]